MFHFLSKLNDQKIETFVITRLLGWIRRQGAHYAMGKGDWFIVRSRRSAHPGPACSSDCVKL